MAAAYYLCSKAQHYVGGNDLAAGKQCPAVSAGRCQGRLTPAGNPEKDVCRRCRRGLMADYPEGGTCCSFCGAIRAPRGSGGTDGAQTA